MMAHTASAGHDGGAVSLSEPTEGPPDSERACATASVKENACTSEGARSLESACASESGTRGLESPHADSVAVGDKRKPDGRASDEAKRQATTLPC